jgi:tRNA(Arg) A34 adenosine deaminase TadA
LKWSELPLPWQVCWEEGWDALRIGSRFIGAVVTRPDGQIVARGRNHIHDNDAPAGQVCANPLAHAELNALLGLSLNPAEVNSYHIYTLLEPCPLCMGAIYMSGVRNIHYAARDPWSGSTNLLGTTPYLSYKPVLVFAPDLTALEITVTAVRVCNEMLLGRGTHVVVNALRPILPGAVQLGERLAVEGRLERWRREDWPAFEVFEEVMALVPRSHAPRGNA